MRVNRKVISALLAALMVLGTVVSVLASEAKVEDMAKIEGVDAKIQYLLDLDHVEGYEDGELKLDRNINRAEITKLLVQAEGYKDLADKEQGMVIYSDVDANHWASGYIAVGTNVTAKANGLKMLNGYPNGEFRPSNDVTYAELSKMLVVLVKNTITKEMHDEANASANWGSNWIQWAKDEGILEDVNVDNPNSFAVRKDAFVMVYNALYNMATRGVVTEAEKAAQESFNKLPIFVDRNGNEIKSGELNIPETGDNDFPYLSQKATRTKNQEGLEKYGYVEKEYFLRGTANVYGLSEDKTNITVVQKDVPYTNRVLVYMPSNPADFKGVVYTEIFNASSGVDLPDLWRRGYEYYMKNGYAYVGITSKDVNVNGLKKFDPERYKVINWNLPGTNKAENGLAWDIFGQVGALLKENNGASRLLYGSNSSAKVERAYLVGQSQSGFYLNTFNNGFGKANYKLGTDQPLYDGMINVVGLFRNTDLSTDNGPIPGLKDSAVPYVVVNAENDYTYMLDKGMVFKPDSSTETNKYRHYVVTGAAHSSKIFQPDLIDELQIRSGRDAGFYLGFVPEEGTGRVHTNNDMDMDVYYNGILKLVDNWVSKGIEPVSIDNPDIKDRDKYGNMVGGLKSPQITVPVAKYTGGANDKMSVDGASMVYLTDDQISERYPNGKSQYLSEYKAAVEQAINDGWIGSYDKDRMLEHSARQSRVIFDKETFDKEFIEKIMTAELEIKGSGTDLVISGPANVYGVLRDNLIYVKKGNLPAGELNHETKVNVSVPTNYNGTVIIDLADGVTKSNIPSGAAHIVIDANQTWELPHLDGKYRHSDGFLWDVISQISNSITDNPGAWGLDAKPTTIKLVGNADRILTYQSVFSEFDGYILAKSDVDLTNAKANVLASIYTKEDGKIVIETKITDTTVPTTKLLVD